MADQWGDNLGPLAYTICYHAGMKEQAGVQYTIRGVPSEVDQALRRKAKLRKQSLNRLILDELAEATTGTQRHEDFSSPLFVLAEIKAGFSGGNQRHRNEMILQRFLAKKTDDVLLPGRETAEQWARLFVQLRRAGTPIPDADLWIAALALEHDLALITRDRHFEKIPQLLRR